MHNLNIHNTTAVYNETCSVGYDIMYSCVRNDGTISLASGIQGCQQNGASSLQVDQQQVSQVVFPSLPEA